MIKRGRCAMARRLARRLASRVVERAALDVGCGDGTLAIELRAAGFACTATELHPRRDADLAARGVDLRVGELDALALAPAAFHVIVLRHVLEHVGDPIATLREARRLLRHDGILVVEVPNLASWQSLLAGDRWFHLDVPRHLYHFSEASLSAVLAASGFRVERRRHLSLEHGPSGWVQSLFNRCGPPWSELYRWIREPQSFRTEDARDAAHEHAIGESMPRRVPVTALALLPFVAILAIAEAAARRGGPSSCGHARARRHRT